MAFKPPAPGLLLGALLLGGGGGLGTRCRPNGAARPSIGTAAPASAPRREIVLRNPSPGVVEIDAAFGVTSAIPVIDAAGALAPVALFAPPQPFTRRCGEAQLEQRASSEYTLRIEAGGALRVPWGEALRRLRSGADGECYEQVAAPAGDYLLRACTRSGRCGLARFAVPGRAPIEVVLRDEQTATPRCEAATVHRALALALGAARLSDIAEAALAGCVPAAAVCDGAELDDEPGACRARITPGPGMFRVELRPAPGAGAALRFEAWVDMDAVGTGNVLREQSTWSATSDGELLVRGTPGYVMHTAGQAPAEVSSAALVAYNRSTRARTLTLRGARWIAPARGSVALAGASLDEGSAGGDAGAGVLLPAGSRTVLSLRFPPQRVFPTHAHFMAEAELGAEGEVLRPRVEFHTTSITVVH